MADRLFETPSDMAKALAASAPVTQFEGRAVTQTEFKVKDLAAGITAALSIAPRRIEHGQRFTVVVEGIIDDVIHTVARGQQLTDPHHTMRRVTTLVTAQVAIVDDPTAAVPVSELFHQQSLQFTEAEQAAEQVQGETGSDGWQAEIAEHAGGDDGDDPEDGDDSEDRDSFEAGTTGRPRLAAVASGGGGDMYDDPDDETL